MSPGCRVLSVPVSGSHKGRTGKEGGGESVKVGQGGGDVGAGDAGGGGWVGVNSLRHCITVIWACGGGH